MSIAPVKMQTVAASLVLAPVIFLLSGCVTKSKADAQARIAFLSGQQQAMMRLQEMQQQQARGPCVTFIGPVRNLVVAWHTGLLLSQAVVGANYLGNNDPAAIVIHRAGQNLPIDTKALLNGDDFPLEVGDVIEIQQ